MTTEPLEKGPRIVRKTKIAETLQDFAKMVKTIKALEAARYPIAQTAVGKATGGAAINSQYLGTGRAEGQT